MQQPLPFTVLKLISKTLIGYQSCAVATALTVYGIETALISRIKFNVLLTRCNSPYRLRYWNRLTTCEYKHMQRKRCNSPYRLRYWNCFCNIRKHRYRTSLLQQPLPFTVLKRSDMMWYRLLPSPRCNSPYRLRYWNSGHSTLMPPSISVATVLIVYGIETWTTINSPPSSLLKLQQYLLFTVLKHSY